MIILLSFTWLFYVFISLKGTQGYECSKQANSDMTKYIN